MSEGTTTPDKQQSTPNQTQPEPAPTEPAENGTTNGNGSEVSSGSYEPAPDDFEAEFDTEDATVPEHPVIVHVRGKGKASARLVKQRELDRLRNDNTTANDADNFNDQALVDIIKRHYVSPSHDDLTVKKYKDSPAGYYDRFFEAIVPEMGNL